MSIMQQGSTSILLLDGISESLKDVNNNGQKLARECPLPKREKYLNISANLQIVQRESLLQQHCIVIKQPK